MIRVDLQIEGEERLDSLDGFGLTYLSSDHRLSAPQKKMDATSYAEEAGEHLDARSVDDAFEFKAKFAAIAEGGRKSYPNPNMLGGTRDFTGSWGNVGNWQDDASTYRGCKVMRSKGNAWQGYYNEVANIEAGVTLTFSAWVKATAPNGVLRMTFCKGSEEKTDPVFANITAAADGKWHRITATFTTTQTATLWPRVECSVAGAVIYIAGFKLERGDVATDYIPQPGEDGYEQFYHEGTRMDMRTANDLIAEFNDRIRTRLTNGVYQYKRITFWDKHKRRKIVGWAQPIGQEPEDFFYCHCESVAVLEMTIKVDNPSLCDFNVPQNQVYVATQDGAALVTESGEPLVVNID